MVRGRSGAGKGRASLLSGMEAMLSSGPGDSSAPDTCGAGVSRSRVIHSPLGQRKSHNSRRKKGFRVEAAVTV